MKNLLKTGVLVLIIFSFFIASGYAFSIKDSEFKMKLHWETGDPGLGNRTLFKFNYDGTFEVPDLGEEYGEYVEITIKSIPDLDLEVNWIEAVWEDTDTTLKIWGSVSESVLESDKLDHPLRVQTLTGDGEITKFSNGSEHYYPFVFFGSNLPEEIEPEVELKAVFSQVMPDTGYQGEMDKDITIFCANTEFTLQSPGIAFENSGIKINSFKVVNDTSIKINIDIKENAYRGKGDIIISLSDGDMIIAKSAFKVWKKL